MKSNTVFIIFISTMYQSINPTPITIQEIDNRLQTVEDELSSMSKNFYGFQQDIINKLESKVKREERGKFVTEAAFDVITQKLEKLENLPVNITNSVTKNEFAKFQLDVARDTALIRYQEQKWITFQKRGQFGNPSDFFARNMKEYVQGFGDPNREFWLGLDKLVSLTNGDTEMLVELETFEGRKIHAHYSNFDVSEDDYRIHVSGYSGNAGDSLRIDNGMAFSTKDNDKDLWVGDCSKTRGGGGWWYNGCSLANLNGLNFGKPMESYEGILWFFFANDKRSFKSSKMMLRKK